MSLPIEMERRIANLKIKRFIDNLVGPSGLIDINETIAFCKSVLNKGGFVVTGEYNGRVVNRDIFDNYNKLIETIFLFPDNDTTLDVTKHPNAKEQYEFCQVLLRDIGFEVEDVISTATAEVKIPFSVGGASGGSSTVPVDYPVDYVGKQLVYSGNAAETLQAVTRLSEDHLLHVTKEELRQTAIRELVHIISHDMLSNWPKYFDLKEEHNLKDQVIMYKATLKVVPKQ